MVFSRVDEMSGVRVMASAWYVEGMNGLVSHILRCIEPGCEVIIPAKVY